MHEPWVQSLGREDLLEKEMAIHSSILSWKIPWMEEPGRLHSIGSQRVGHDWMTSCTSVWGECNCEVVWAFFGIAFLWDWNESWPFPVLWPLLSFRNFLAYGVQHFHSTIFQDWNSSTGIPSPPLALFIAVLSKGHLTSHSRISITYKYNNLIIYVNLFY